MKQPHDLLAVLSRHIGEENGISAEDLARQLDITTRQVRELVSHLRMAGAHVCGHPKTGYFMAANEDELFRTIDYLTKRSFHGLVMVSRMKNVSVPDLVGQFHLPT